MDASTNPTPSLSLSAVTRRTGLSAHTLRAWERRYGLPRPQRSPGGHRLYSRRDVDTIRWLQARLDEGMRIAQAAALWHELESRGEDPLQSHPLPAAQPVQRAALEDLRAGWVQACLRFDEAGAEGLLTQAFALYPVELVCVELLQRGLWEIGDLWYRNRASVQQEHFASRLALRRVENLIAAAPPPTRGGSLLLACPPGERHIFPLLELELFLRRRGWQTVNLGADVPREQLDAVVAQVRPALVVMNAQRLVTASALPSVGEAFAGQGVPLVFGGRIFTLQPALAARVPGHFLGNTLEGAVERITSWLPRPPSPPAVRPLPAALQRARQAFITRRLRLEDALLERLADNPLLPEHTRLAVRFLGDTLDAALALDALDALRPELSWLAALLESRHLPAAALRDFLRLYSETLLSVCGEAVRPLAEALDLFRVSYLQ